MGLQIRDQSWVNSVEYLWVVAPVKHDMLVDALKLADVLPINSILDKEQWFFTEGNGHASFLI
jgi:hypothetical protein